MKLELLTKEERETIEARVALAFRRGIAECESDVTWADPERPSDGSLTALDEAYDMGRAWAFEHMLK